MQRNLAEDAANQRQLSLRHIEPEPFEDMFNLDNQAEMFDNQMTSEHKTKLRDWQSDIRRIKGGHASKAYNNERTRTIEAAAAHYEKHQDKNHKSIPDFLYTVKQPWSAGMGQANLRYDEDQVYRIERKIQQLRETNAQLCQMEINMDGPTSQGAF
jgi:hypothetical protein